MVNLSTILNAILSSIFPAYCSGCKARGSDLCISCLADFPEAERQCAAWIFPIFDYRHPPVKKTIWLLKYKGRRPLATIFAKELYGRLLEELSDLRVMQNFKDPLLIPVPLSRSGLRARGFNQALLIAKELVNLDRNLNFKIENGVLLKSRDTKHQARIENRNERLKNVIGSFRVKDSSKIKNRNIILIDDVTTTGATLSEARKILRNAGARKVIAFTVAH